MTGAEGNNLCTMLIINVASLSRDFMVLADAKIRAYKDFPRGVFFKQLQLLVVPKALSAVPCDTTCGQGIFLCRVRMHPDPPARVAIFTSVRGWA